MGACSFYEFKDYESIEKFCKDKNFTIKKEDGYSIIGEVYNENNAPVGYISNRAKDYTIKDKSTKYVVVWT